MITFFFKIDKSDHLLHMIRVQTARGPETAAYGDAFLHAETGKGLRDLECAGDTGFGNAVRWLTGDVPAVKFDLAFIGVKSGDQVVYGGFTGSVGPGDAEYLPSCTSKLRLSTAFSAPNRFVTLKALSILKPSGNMMRYL